MTTAPVGEGPRREGPTRTRRLALAVVAVVVVAVGVVAALSLTSGYESGPLLPAVVPDPPAMPLPPAARTFYVDEGDGSDDASGGSPDDAWETLDRAAQAPLQPGDRLLLRRGAHWNGTLRIEHSGEQGSEIVVGAYGEGPPPRISEGSAPEARVEGRNRVGSSTGACIRVEASFVRVRDIEVSDCRPARAGIHVRGDRNLVEGMTIRDNEAGVVVAGGSGNRIIGNLMRDNSLMTVDNCNSEGSSEGDYGAYNVAVERASGTEIAHNYASGAVGSSCDYGIDGSMVEIFEGQDTDVHHNVSVGNAAFAEVGGAGSANQRFSYNQVTGDAEEIAGFVLHGGGTYAGAEGIVLLHNSVRLQGSRSIGLGCFEDCSPEILHARNNIFAAEVAVRSPAPFDDANNLYSGEVETDIGPSSIVGDPGFVDGPGVALTPGSRAVDAAAAPSEPEGRPADGKPDIGALELRPTA